MEYKLKNNENVYEILYYHNYGDPTIQNYVCVANDENGALQKFWDGRNKDAWEVKEIHSYVNNFKNPNDEVENDFKIMKFLFIERVIYSDGVNNIYEHEIQGASYKEVFEKASKKLEETKKLIGRDGRCSFVDLRKVSPI